MKYPNDRSGFRRAAKAGSGLMNRGGRRRQHLTRDIRGRKQTEARLKEVTWQFTSFLNTMPDLMWMKDKEGKYLQCNAAFAKFFGMEEHEVVGKTHYDLLEKGTGDTCQQSDLEALTSGTVIVRRENIIYPGSGRSGTMEVRKIPVTGSAGKISGVLGIARDITEQLRMEKELRQSEAKFSRFFHNSRIAVSFYSLERQIYLDANDTFLQRTGYSYEEVIGQNADMLFAEQKDRQLFREELQTKGSVEGLEISYRRKNGTTGIALAYGSLMELDGEQCIIVDTYDITERKMMEVQLNSQKEFQETLIKGIAEAGLLLTVITDGKFTYINHIRKARENGYDATVLAENQDFINIVHPDERARQQDRHERRLKGEDFASTYEVGLVRGDGQRRDHEISNVVIPNTDPAQVIVLAKDITESKQRQTLLEQREQEFRTIMEHLPDFIIRYDRDGTRIYVNPAFASFVGKRAEELIGKKPTYDFNLPQVKSFEAVVTRVFNSGLEEEIEYSLPDVNGRMTTLLFYLCPEKDSSGYSQSVLATGRDITKIKENECALQQALSTNENFINAIPDPLFELDDEGNYLNVWSHGSTLPAQQKEALLGRNLRDILSPEATRIFFAALAEAKRNGTTISQAYPVALSGGERWFEASVAKNAEGGFIVLSRDVTERKELEALLREREQAFSSLAANLPDGVARWDTRGHYLYANPTHARTLRIPDSELIGKHITDLFSVSSMAVTTFTQVVKTGKAVLSVRQNIQGKNGEDQFREVSMIPERNADGEIISVLGIGRDVTERVKMHQELATKEEQFRTIAENTPDTIVRYDQEYRRIYANPAFTTLAGKPVAELLGKRPTDDYHCPREKVFEETLAEVLNGGNEVQFEHTWPDADGQMMTSLFHFVPEKDSFGNVQSVLSTGRDITRLRETQKMLEHMARHDRLTGLPNRMTVEEETDRAIAAAQRHGKKLALLFVDLDNFKAVNDTLGHASGDVLLKEVSQRLKFCVREIDMVGRQGGDEFVITLTEVEDAKQVAAIVSRLFRQFEQPIIVEEQALSVHMSIGIALYPDNGDSCLTLMKMADSAMYEAKEAGRNTYRFFSEQMNRATLEHLTMQSDLKRALTENEICLHYQPQIDAITGTIIGAEALLRWEHPDKGMIPPLQFIPMAESSGLIISVGKWIIEQACRQAALWYAKGMELSVAVNISAVQFKRGDLVETVKQALEDSGLEARFLELELTESVIMQDTDATLSAVRQLKNLGVQLAIDDFGTGYSSLAYLKRFAADKLKIDRSFVRDIVHNADDAAIVRAIIQMARSLGVATIAEGVEDQKTLKLLQDLACDTIQGFLFSPALNKTDFAMFCEKHATLSMAG